MNNLTPPPVYPGSSLPKALSSQEVACHYCGLFGMCEAAGLSRDTPMLEQVVQRRTALARGATLYRSTEPFKYLYAVKSGALAAVVDDGAGQRKILGFYFPGDVLGLDGIDCQHYQETVEALEQSSICKLDYANVSLLGEHQEGFYRELIHAMSNRLAFERWTTLLLGAQSTEQRLAAFLIYLSSQLQVRGLPHVTFRLPMTRRDIADYLGLAMETISRAFSSLQNKGLMAVKGRNMHIADLEGLHEVAGLSPELTACSGSERSG